MTRGTVVATSRTGTPGRFLVVYQVGGKGRFHAYAEQNLPEGREITVEDGRVVA